MGAGKEIKDGAPVIVVGAGPTGLSLALALARQDIRSILVERNRGTTKISKAPVIHVRTREIFQKWDIEQKMLQAGHLMQTVRVHSPTDNQILFSIDFGILRKETSRPGILILGQNETERILLNALRETGLCDIRMGTRAVGLHHNENGVELKVKNENEEYSLCSKYLVGCDGAGSFVRQSLNLSFDGFTYSLGAVLADVKIEDERDSKGSPVFYNGKEITLGVRLKPQLWRLIHLNSGQPEEERKVSKKEISNRVEEVLGEGDFEMEWANSFRIHRRSSQKFRVGRVLLAGDAAHVHSPAGGQGMNSGIQDADNLAWKLKACLRDGNEDILLNSYEDERKAVVLSKVSGYTDFITRIFLQAPLFLRKASFLMLRNLLKVKKARSIVLRRATMINLHYGNSEILMAESRAAGKRLPNPHLFSEKSGRVRLYQLLGNSPVILQIGEMETIQTDLPVISIKTGVYSEPYDILQNYLEEKRGFILVRPDAHIAWAGKDRHLLQKAIKISFGDWI